MTTHNLPLQTTPFVGRTAALTELAALITDPDCRLLTLTGPGGVGKTRLAIEVARRAQAAFPDGAFFVALAPLRAREDIVTAIAGAVRCPLQGGEPARQQVLEFLRRKRLLLVLDNFEHVLDHADLVADLLAAAPALSVLVTSREVLQLQSEWVRRVDGMAYPTDTSGPDPATYGAVQFFATCARRTTEDFSLQDELEAVLRICGLVEGLPLGLELAASWLRTLTGAEIADELEHGLDLLATRAPDIEARHRNMRTVLDHSWALLTPDEQITLRRLAVFRGGFTREAFRAVTQAALPTLSALVDKSLVMPGQHRRYHLHELVRQYAKERLAADPDEDDATRDRHAAYYADYLAALEPHLRGAHREDVEALERDIDNVRSAWSWALAHQQVPVLGQMVLPLFRFHDHRGTHNDVWEMIGAALAVARRFDDQAALCQMLICYGLAGRLVGDLGQAEANSHEALAIARQLESQHLEAEALWCLGPVLIDQGQLAAGQAALKDCVSVGRSAGARMVVADALQWLAFQPMMDEDYDLYERYVVEALELARQTDLRWCTCLTLGRLAVTAFVVRGEREQGQALLDEALTLSQQTVAPWLAAWLLTTAGWFSNLQGDNDGARRYALELFRIADEQPIVAGGRDTVCLAAAIAARVLADAGKTQRATELLAFATKWTWLLFPQLLIEPAITYLRTALGTETFASAWDEGRQVDVDELAAETVAWLQTGLSSTARTVRLPLTPNTQPLLDPLTARETEVLQLIAQGYTNPEIADMLVIAPATVKKHVNRIFSKLDVTHRAEAVVRALELGLAE